MGTELGDAGPADREIDAGTTAAVLVAGVALTVVSLVYQRIYVAAGFVAVLALVTHFVIYSRTVSYPLLPPLLFLLVCLPILWVNELLGVSVYVLLVGLFVSLRFSESVVVRLVLPTLFAVGVLIQVWSFQTLSGGDAQSFFLQLELYESVTDYLVTVGDGLLTDPVRTLRNSRRLFPFLYLPFYSILGLSSPESIVIVNVLLWLATALLFRELIERQFDGVPAYSANLVFALLLLSPSAMYWSSTFTKEVASVFLVVLATYLVFRERYVLAALVLVVATGVRPYSIAIVAIYVAVFLRSIRLLVLGLLGSLAVVLVYSGSVFPVVNSAVIGPYLFASPEPVDPTNWLSWVVFPRTLEGVFVGGVFGLSVLIALASREYLRHFLLLGLGVAIYALVLALVGYHTWVNNGNQYGLFVLGDNLLRKKMPIMPLVFLWVTYALGVFRAESVLPVVEFRP